MVLPVTWSQTIAYDAPDHQQARQSKTKRSAFDQVLQEQMKGQEMEADQTFQLYCQEIAISQGEKMQMTDYCEQKALH